MIYKKYFTKTELAELFGYANISSFSGSSAKERILTGINGVIQRVEELESVRHQLIQEEYDKRITVLTNIIAKYQKAIDTLVELKGNKD